MASLKRRSETSLDRVSKKSKGPVPPFHSSLKRSATEVLASEGKETNVFMRLRAAMVWRHDRDGKELKRRVCFEDMTAKDKNPRQFEVLFTGKCLLLWDHLSLAINDEILLSTRGSLFTRVPLGSLNVIKLPFQLTYDDGCIVKFVQRIGRGKTNKTVVDLWNIKDSSLLEMDADSAKDVVILGPSSQDVRQHNDTLVPINHHNAGALPPASLAHTSMARPNNENAQPSLQVGNAQPSCSTSMSNEVVGEPSIAPVKETAKQRRKREHMEAAARKKRAKAALRQREQLSAPVDERNPQVEFLEKHADVVASVSGDIEMRSEISGNPDVSPVECDQSISTSVRQSTAPVHGSNDVTESPPEEHKHHLGVPDPEFPDVELVAGWPGYRPLGCLALPEAVGIEYSVIGVVTKARYIYRTGSGDWSQSVSIIDPSNFQRSNAACYRAGDGFTVNLFTKRYAQWLPSPKEGDILILKTVKAVKKGDTMFGTVYYDKLKWAIYDPATGELHHGDRGDAPLSEGLNEGTGAILCPFYDPPSPKHELFYCQKLGEWWREIVTKRDKERGSVHQVGPSRRNNRIHRLISEANQDCEPAGYFDCTVQFLQGYSNDSGVYSIYVTDYTSNPGLSKNDRYGERLQDMILKIEMWDEAAKIGPTMVPDCFYSLNNCRMLIKQTELQGKIVEKKIRRLDEEVDKEHECFSRLLERKAMVVSGAPDRPCPLWNIQEAEPDRFFNCSVELLHKIIEEGGTYIFVTDYTPNDKFSNVAPVQPWSEGLENRVLKIKVFGGVNTDKVQGMPVGSFYRLGKVRFWNYGHTWVCHLKEQGSISKMNTKSATDDHLKDLLRRREGWKKSHGDNSADPSILDSISNPPRTASVEPAPTDFPVIKKYPCKFDAVARIIDFYPHQLADCLVLQCEKCRKQLHGLLRACPDCTEATMEGAAVLYRCSLFFILRDTAGKEIVASACDPDCSLMKDLNCASEEAYIESLQARLNPFLGNLVEVHSGLERGEEIEPKTAEMMFTVVTWLDSEEKERYGLLNVAGL